MFVLCDIVVVGHATGKYLSASSADYFESKKYARKACHTTLRDHSGMLHMAVTAPLLPIS